MTLQADSRELHCALESIFHRAVGHVHRRPFPPASSFAMEDLTVLFADGSPLDVLLKDVGPGALLADALAVKPAFLYHPEREIAVYRSILSTSALGTPAMYGAIVDRTRERYWLFLERLQAPELFQIGDFDVWSEAARWLARLHSAPACDPKRARTAAPQLLEYDTPFCHRWIDRACRSLGGAIEHIAKRSEHIIGAMLALPRTLIHGEYYASNILIQRHASGLRICPVDWEMAGIGPALLDLAALAAGKWSRDQRLKLLLAYCDALPPALRASDPVTAFDCCQLYIALQWMGWSDRWSPPGSHAHTWLNEALCLSSSKSSLAHLFS